jgi:hypothetical protein
MSFGYRWAACCRRIRLHHNGDEYWSLTDCKTMRGGSRAF